jgi:uncharacterized protein
MPQDWSSTWSSWRLCERHGVGHLLVFGSGTRGSDHPGSDLYDLRPWRHLGWEISDLEDELSDVFGRPVDLISRAGLHPRLRAVVLTEARSIYAA